MKTKKNLIIFKLIFLFIFPLILSAQQPKERYLNFSGVVMDSDSLKPIINVYYSLNGRLEGISDSGGRFSIYARIGDTLSFSHIGYRTKIFNVSDSLLLDNYLVGIFMTRDTIRIQEIVIFPRLGNLRQEMTSIGNRRDFQNDIAKQNLDIATYQGLKSAQDLSDPEIQYDFQASKLKQDAIEKGGIPSDKMVSVSIFTGVALIMSLLLEDKSELLKPVKLPDTQEVKWIKNYYIKKLAPVSLRDSTEIMKGTQD
jgi:hypothetical protein